MSARPGIVTLYKHNRVDEAYDADLTELRQRFVAWRESDEGWMASPVDRAAGYFLSAVEDATPDEADLRSVLDALVAPR